MQNNENESGEFQEFSGDQNESCSLDRGSIYSDTIVRLLEDRQNVCETSPDRGVRFCSFRMFYENINPSF